MGDFINNLIPYGTDMTPYYIGVGIIIWIIGLIFTASTPRIRQETFMFFVCIWSVLCMFWFVLVIYAILAIPVTIIWKIFGDKS